MKNTRKIGEKGEQIAVEFLETKGYKIFAKNVSSAQGEIDIVTKNPTGVWCMVEVKFRQNQKFGSIYEILDAKKIQKIALTAEKFLESETDQYFEIHAVLILQTPKGLVVEHFENIGEE